LLPELSTADEFGVALDVGLPAELDEFAGELIGRSPKLLELIAELSGRSAELEAGLEPLEFNPTEELL
jgi:hypothetical protein